MKIMIYCLLYIFISVTRSLELNSSQMDGKIVDGIPVEERNVGFMASLRLKNSHICSGCLISGRHTLTAGYCVYHIHQFDGPYNFRIVTVVVGMTNLSSGGTELNVKRALHYKKFLGKHGIASSNYDIGVIELTKDFLDMNAYWLPMSKSHVTSGTTALMIGWSTNKTQQINSSQQHRPKTLFSLNIYIHGPAACKAIFTQMNFTLYQMCGRGFKKSETCGWEDLGGPLIQNGNELIGIATGVTGSADNLPIRFIRVAYFKKNIDKVMATPPNNPYVF